MYLVETPVRVAVKEALPNSIQGQILDATKRVLQSLKIFTLKAVEVEQLNSLYLATYQHFACLNKEEVDLACDFILSLHAGTRANVADVLATRFSFDLLVSHYSSLCGPSGNITEHIFYCCRLHRVVS